MVAAPVDTFAEAGKRFPNPEKAEPARLARVEGLKQEFLRLKPEPRPAVVEYWHRYQQVFSPDGLRKFDPHNLKDFAITEIGARPGNMSSLTPRGKSWEPMRQPIAPGTPSSNSSTARRLFP